MKKIIYLSVLLLAAGLITFSCSKGDSSENTTTETPTISKIDPPEGPVGQLVTIEGSNFSETESQNTVTFGTATATPSVATPNKLTVNVPQGATSGPVKVTVAGKTATGGTFTITENMVKPSISLNKNTLELYTLDSETLVPSIVGTGNVTDIEWTSEDESIAIVDDNGKVTGVSEGRAIVTADLGNDVSVECMVIVSPSVFAVGYEEVNGMFVAKMWKNGKVMNLPNSGEYSFATSVFVDGTDIYISGVVENQNENPSAVVWKNGELQYELSDGSTYGFASSIYVYNGEEYVVGSEEIGQNNISNARIWKDGTVYETLTNGMSVDDGASGEDIFVNETGIYSAGYEESAQHVNGTPKLWEDTTQIDLTDETYHGRAYSVYAIGSDVYVAGYEENNGGTSIAKYWKDGVATNLSDGSQSAEALSIFVMGEDVYVAGNYYEDQQQQILQQAVVWKNNVPTSLEAGSGASSIHVYGEDVFVGGLVSQANFINAMVWKNEQPMELELEESSGNSLVFSVFVK